MNNDLYEFIESRRQLDEFATLHSKAKEALSAARQRINQSKLAHRLNQTKVGRHLQRRQVLGGDIAKQTKDWKARDVDLKLSQHSRKTPTGQATGRTTTGQTTVQSKASRLKELRKRDPVAAGVGKPPTAAPAATSTSTIGQRAGEFLKKNPGVTKGLKVAGAGAAIAGAGMLARKMLKRRKPQTNLEMQKAKLSASHDVSYDLQEAAEQLTHLRTKRLRNLHA